MIGKTGLFDIPSWFIISYIIFYVIHSVIRYVVQVFFQQHGQCTSHRIATKLVSAVQAIIVSIISLRTLLTVDDLLHGRDTILETYILLGSAYFSYDTVVMFQGYVLLQNIETLSWKQKWYRFFKDELLIIVHHFVAQFILLPILLVWMNNRGIFFIAGFFLAEISTPFYSLRNILKMLSLEKSNLYVINGIFFAISFFIGRVFMVPYMYFRYSVYKNMSFFHVPFHIPLHCNIVSFLFFILQFYWFHLVIYSLVKYQRKYFSKLLCTGKFR